MRLILYHTITRLLFIRLMNFIHVINLHLYHIWENRCVNYEYAIADDMILSKLHIGSIPVQRTSLMPSAKLRCLLIDEKINDTHRFLVALHKSNLLK